MNSTLKVPTLAALLAMQSLAPKNLSERAMVPLSVTVHEGTSLSVTVAPDGRTPADSWAQKIASLATPQALALSVLRS